MTNPEWLSKRDGSLRAGLNASTVLVLLGGHPQYKIVAGPASGKYTCAVTQTNNAKRLDGGANYPTLDAAITGGLEELRMKLGW
jgi:hypothetical protein